MSFKMKPDIIIYGGPGSGKSTQAELLVKKLGARHMNMGGLLRTAVAKKASGWQTAKKYMDKGGLVPERINSQLVHDFVAKIAKSKRIVFDGYPRSLLQIHLFEKTQRQFGREAMMVFVNLPTRVAKQRLVKRAKLENRLDDARPQTVAERLRVFRERSKEVIKHFRQQGCFIKIDGDQTVPRVAHDIWQAVRKL